MALKLIIHFSKKIPGPQEFSSINAGCSIEGELGNGQDPATETSRLFAQAEAAVHQQLGIRSAAEPIKPHVLATHHPDTAIPDTHRPRSTTTLPFRSGTSGRPPAPVTESQLRLLDVLLRNSGTNPAIILAKYQVRSLHDLSCKSASAAIDALKNQSVPA